MHVLFVLVEYASAFTHCHTVPRVQAQGVLGKTNAVHVHRYMWEEAQRASSSEIMVVAAVTVGEDSHCSRQTCKRTPAKPIALNVVIHMPARSWHE